MDLTYRSGNTELLTIQTRYRTDYLNPVYHGFAFGSIQYGREGDSFFTNKGIAHGRIIRNVVNHIQLESFVQKQFNESIYLNDRNLIGGEFRFAVLPSKSKYNLYLGIGGMWEHERINASDVGELTTHIVRSTNYVNWTVQLKERLSTSATGYYQVHVRRLGTIESYLKVVLSSMLRTR